MTVEEFKVKMTAVFEAHDTNKNGYLELEEAKKLAQAMAAQHNKEYNEERFTEMFNSQAPDGHLTLEKFLENAVQKGTEQGLCA